MPAPVPTPAPPPAAPWSTRLPVVILAVVAAGLRFWGIDTGAPYRVGVDEPVIAEIALRILRTGDLHPHFFDYGGLTFYLHAAVGGLTFLAGAHQGRWNHLDQLWEGDLLVGGRLATALIGAATVLLVFSAGRRWGTAVGLAAAAVMAVLPPHVRESHFMLTDTPVTALVTLALVLALQGMDRQRLALVLGSAAAVGLAAAVKYPGAVAIVLPIAAAFSLPLPRLYHALWLTPLVTLAAFLAAAPYTLLDLPAFLNGLAHLMQSYDADRPLHVSALTYLAYLRNWFTWPGVLPAPFGYVALLVATWGWIAALIERGPHRRAATGLVTFALVFFWFVSSQSLQYGRYLLPLAPVLCLGIGLGATSLAGRFAVTPSRRTMLTAAILCVLLTAPLLAALDWNRTNSRLGTIDQAAAWLVAHARQGERVVAETTTFRLPPAIPLTFSTGLAARPWETYRQEGATYLVAASSHVDRYRANPAAHARELDEYRRMMGFTEVLATFAPSDDHPGPSITILRLPAASAPQPD